MAMSETPSKSTHEEILVHIENEVSETPEFRELIAYLSCFYVPGRHAIIKCIRDGTNEYFFSEVR
jgi:hypothetical protein